MERNRKRRQELEAEEQARLNAALSEFREAFEDSPTRPSKAFIRGDVVNPALNTPTQQKPLGGTIAFDLKPAGSLPLQKSGLSSSALEQAKKLAQERAKKILKEAATANASAAAAQVQLAPAPRPNRPPKPGVKTSSNGKQSSKSNLEQFREELRQIQQAREQRKGLRQQLQQQLGVDEHAINKIVPLETFPAGGNGEYDNDPFTTNLYLSNLPLTIEMQDLYATFGTFGPLASAKILFPRPDEERRREYLCGFVAYMSRTDAERAMSAMQRYNLKGNDIKVSFAKPVTLPPQPFYLPPALAEFMVPDPPTGLPFNAKPDTDDLQHFLRKYHSLPPVNMPLPTDRPEFVEDYMKMISRAVVRVVIPTERPLLIVIHRTVEFIVRSGPQFEYHLIQREGNNPMFRFLYDLHHPAHVYYRWKVFSICQGDTPDKWRTERFKMYQHGSWWDPPPLDNLLLTMPPQLYKTAFRQPIDYEALKRMAENSPSRKRCASADDSDPGEQKRQRRGELTRSERTELDDLLYDLVPEKRVIADTMVWCIEHAECAKEIVEIIFEAIQDRDRPLHKVIALLYLAVDVISNSAVNVRGAFYYRQYFGDRLMSMCSVLHKVHSDIEARMKAEQFKQRVMLCFRVWEDNSVYPTETLIRWQNVFLGLYKESDYSGARGSKSGKVEEEDIDGAPLSDNEEDIDGVPLDDDDVADVFKPKPKTEIAFKPIKPAESAQPSVSSKWDSIDEEDIDGVPLDESMEASSNNPGEAVPENRTSAEMDERRRQLLRNVELKVVRYQDELESQNHGNTDRLVSDYRRELLREMEENLANGSAAEPSSECSPKKSSKRDKEKEKHRSRSRSHRDRSRSRSPRRHRDRSRDRDRDKRGYSKR